MDRVIDIPNTDVRVNIDTGAIIKVVKGRKTKKFIRYKDVTILKDRRHPGKYVVFVRGLNVNHNLVNYNDLIMSAREYYETGTFKLLSNCVVIFKDGGYTNTSFNNMVLNKGLDIFYYRYKHEFSKYIENRVSIIDNTYTVQEAMEDGLVVVRKVDEHFYIDTNGLVFNVDKLKFIKPNINSTGYPAINLYRKPNGNYKYSNVITLLGKTFLGIKEDEVVTLINGVGRTNTLLSNLKVSTRKDVASDYHKDNPEDRYKYLLKYNKGGVSVLVNGVKYNTIIEAAKFIEEDMIYVKCIDTILSLIRNRLAGRTKPHLLMYNTYKIEKCDG